MLFVTVGTHEQQFNRLVEAIDHLKMDGTIIDTVYIQTGYSTYEPNYCEHMQFLSCTKMRAMMERADVIVTHGGPSSIFEAFSSGKTPVVVPRRSDYGEHVNDHQVEFVRAVAERRGGIVPVFDISDLTGAIELAREISQFPVFNSNNATFCKSLKSLIDML